MNGPIGAIAAAASTGKRPVDLALKPAAPTSADRIKRIRWPRMVWGGLRLVLSVARDGWRAAIGKTGHSGGALANVSDPSGSVACPETFDFADQA
jgi:hypothetical protein